MQVGVRARERDDRGYWRRALETAGRMLPVLVVLWVAAVAYIRIAVRSDWEPALEAAIAQEREDGMRREDQLRKWLCRVEDKLDAALLRMPR